MTPLQLLADDTFVDTLRRRLRAHVVKRFPVLGSQADDLVSQAITDLWWFASKPSSGAPRSPLAPAPNTSHNDAVSTVQRLGYAIVDRRAVDVLRRPATQWIEERLSDEATSRADNTPDPQPSHNRRLLLSQMLRVCISELSQMPKADRDLLWSVAMGGDDKRSSLSMAERQQLSRARKRLAAGFVAKLGESARSLLASDLEDQ